jgi:hypothetical protein
MDKNVIIKETMKKLNQHLISFLDEKKNILNNQIISILSDTIKQKYAKYLDDIEVQKNVNEFICEIYENTRERAVQNYNYLKN